jgi:hypothetical protein
MEAPAIMVAKLRREDKRGMNQTLFEEDSTKRKTWMSSAFT